MNKIVSLCCGMFLFYGIEGYSQKKQNPIKKLEIKSEADSISYVWGQATAQGLPNYLQQLGVLKDTAALGESYKQKIEAEQDPTKKAKLKQELKAEVNSYNEQNKKNIAQFLEGFNIAMSAGESKKAYNTGISIAGQIDNMLVNGATQLFEDQKSLNKQAFLDSFVGSLTGKEPLFTQENPQQYMQVKSEKIQALRTVKEEEERKKQEEELKKQYSDKIEKEAKIFQENKNKQGITVRPSGLQYEVLKKGTGVIPKVHDKVKVHYHGTLIDGTVFDSSVDRGEPVEFSVGQLIRGFNEALLIMPEGSKWKVYIPYDLAYGAADMGMIKPFSNLIFEIELLQVGDETKKEVNTTENKEESAKSKKDKKNKK